MRPSRGVLKSDDIFAKDFLNKELIAVLGNTFIFRLQNEWKAQDTTLFIQASPAQCLNKELTAVLGNNFIFRLHFSLLWILNGAGQALIAISSSTLLAEHTVAEGRGRAYAVHFALTHACWLITYPAVGHAAAKWGAPATFTAAGFVCLLVTIAARVFGRDVPRAHTHTRDGEPAVG